MRLIDAHLAAERIENSDLPNNWKDALLSCLSSTPTITPPPNDPLTPDELREMDGDLVWVVTVRLSEWCIVHSCHSADVIGGGIIMTRRTAEKRIYPYADYGKAWMAYRSKPEGD